MQRKFLIFIFALIIILVISFIIIHVALTDNKNPNLIIQPEKAKNPPDNTDGGNNSIQTTQNNENLLLKKFKNFGETENKDLLFDVDLGKSCIFVGDLNGSDNLYSPFYGYFSEKYINEKNIDINIDAITIDSSREDILYIHVYSPYISGIYILDTSRTEEGWILLISTGSNTEKGIINCKDILDKCIDSKITDLTFDYDTLYITTPSIIYKYIERREDIEIYKYNDKTILGFDILNNNAVFIDLDKNIIHNDQKIGKGVRRPSFIKFLNESYYVYIDEEEYIVSNSIEERRFKTDFIKSFNCSNNNIVLVEETGEVNLIKQREFDILSSIKFKEEIKINNNHVVVGIGRDKFYIISTYTDGSVDQDWYCN